jgi:hypothetical protein
LVPCRCGLLDHLRASRIARRIYRKNLKVEPRR